MNQQKNSVSEKGHGYFRKRNKALVSMITLFGALMVSSVAMADEVNSNPTSEISATAQPVATNTSTPTTTSEEGTTTEATSSPSESTPTVTATQPVSAAPATTYNTPKITNDVTFDKATYKSGEDVRISINNSEVVSSDVTVSHLDQVIYEKKNVEGSELTIPSTVFSPNAGFIVDVLGKKADGSQAFHKAAGLAVEDDWTIYPRYGVVAGSKDNHNSITNDQVEGYKNSID